MSSLWTKRWTPTGSKLIVALFVMAATVMSALTFGAVTVSGGAGADTTPFNVGTASAGATALEIDPSLAQLNLAIQLGSSDADFEYSEAQALSQTLDLGEIGSILTSPTCNSPATIKSSDFPAAIQAESTSGNQTLHSVAETSLNGTGAGVGVEDATATQVPAGTSTTTIASDDLAGLVKILGATTSATTEIQNNDERVATATADVGSISLANGVIVLDGLHWEATQTSGATSSSSGTFTIGSLKIAGITIPINTDTIETITTLINTALEPTGFEILWPTASVLSDGTQVISPLTIGIDNSALGQQIVGSQLNTVQPLRNVLEQELLGISNCTLESDSQSALLIADIFLGVPSGGGDVNITIGGAKAVTDDTVASSPFGSLGSTDLGSGLGSTLPTTTSSLPFTEGPIGGTGTTLPTTTTPTTTPSGTKIKLGPVSKSVSCHSIGPAGGGCVTSNSAVPVGIVGLVLLALLAGWDFVRQRRRAQLAAIRGGAG
jgi:hypothetical protein